MANRLYTVGHSSQTQEEFLYLPELDMRFEIKSKMEENRNGKIQTDNFSISFSPSKTVMQFDSKTFKAENAELYIKYSKPKLRPSSIVIKQLKVEN